MIRLVNKPNTNTATTPYPYGSLRDNTGANDGTPVNKFVVEDLHQLAERVFAQSGLTANGLPDNATNGWQLFEALMAAVEDSITPTYSGDYTSNLSSPLKIRKVPGRMVQFTGRVGSTAGVDISAGGSATMFTLPASHRPASTKNFYGFSNVSNKFYRIKIENTGAVILYADTSATPSYNLSLEFVFALD